MEGMSLKETSDKDEKPCMVVYCHDTAPSTKGKLAEGSEVLCNPGCMRHYLNNNNDKIIRTTLLRGGRVDLVLYDLGTWLPKNVTVRELKACSV